MGHPISFRSGKDCTAGLGFMLLVCTATSEGVLALCPLSDGSSKYANVSFLSGKSSETVH